MIFHFRFGKLLESAMGIGHKGPLNILGVSYISGEPAKLLGLEKGSVVFLIRGITYIKDGRAIECEESFYRSDK